MVQLGNEVVQLFSSRVETSLNTAIDEGSGRLYYIVESDGYTNDYWDYDEAFLNYVIITRNKQNGF